MDKPRILHIAPENFAGMPIDFVKMHRNAGYDAHLVTMYSSPIKYEADISLNLPLPRSKISKKWRNQKFFKNAKTGNVKYYSEKNSFEKIFFAIRDRKNRDKILNSIMKYKLYDFDIYHFDGGMDFFRDSRFAKQLKSMGKKIVMCYFGSDLRTRGIFKDMESISNLNLTVEFDHLKIYKNVNYIFFPVHFPEIIFQEKNYFGKLKIIHSPTNRTFKGTDSILKVISKLKNDFDFEFILAENMQREELLRLKKNCHLAIDTVGGIYGGSGYGKNSIENLSFGLPTITEFTKDYKEFLPENPFISSNIDELYNVIAGILKEPQVLNKYAEAGINWVKKYHGFESVNNRLEDLYKVAGII